MWGLTFGEPLKCGGLYIHSPRLNTSLTWDFPVLDSRLSGPKKGLSRSFISITIHFAIDNNDLSKEGNDGGVVFRGGTGHEAPLCYS